MSLVKPIRTRIDLSQKYDKIFFVTQQFEKDSRILEFEITHNQAPFFIPDGVAIYIQVGDFVFNKCNVKDNVISIKFTQAMCKKEGVHNAKLIFTTEDSVLYSTLFKYRVEGGLVNPQVIVPEKEYNGLLEALVEVQKSIAEVTATTKQCIEDTNAAIQKCEEEIANSVTVRNEMSELHNEVLQAEQSRVIAETARVNAENLRVSAEESRVVEDQERSEKTDTALANMNEANTTANSLIETMRSLIEEFNSLETGVLSKVYPVGSIYTTEYDTNPNELFGGTWELYGKGKVLVCADPDDPDFSTAGTTGGAKSIDLSHSHTVNSHTHSVGAHVHSLNGHTHSISHTHNIAAHKHATTVGADGVSMYINGNLNGTGSTGSAGSFVAETDHQSWQMTGLVHGNARYHYTEAKALTTGGASSGTSGASSGNTGNNGSFNSGGASPNTDSQLTTAKSVVQPYITVYRWLRTA